MLIGRWALFLFAVQYKDLENAVQTIKNTNDGTVWIDVENVRGKSGFEMDHQEVLNKASRWTKHHGLEGKVIAVVDHGSENTALYLDNLDIAVTFSGREKADDVIANAVGHFDASIVVTADGGLRSRCTRANGKNVINIDPTRFIDDLEATYDEDLSAEIHNTENADTKTRTDMERKMEEEIKLRAELLDTQIQLEKKKNATNKRKKKLEAKVAKLRARLAARGTSLLNEMTDIPSDTNDLEKQEQLLSRWQELRQQFSRREQTGDRVIMAEWLRRQLIASPDATTKFAGADISPARAFVRRLNQNDMFSSLQRGSEIQTPSTLSKQAEVSTFELLSEQTHETASQGELTMTVISDTHGFEGQLTNDGTSSGMLPESDVLLHLGDFAVDSNKARKGALVDFDRWLSVQPHRYKIVVRGNHDPLTCDFPLSGAWFVRDPCSATIANVTFAFVPFGSPRKLTASGNIPSECDVFVSHVPPYKVLDTTCTKDNAGSPFLTKLVHSMKGKAAPRLWMCGHIHESRGKMEYQFGGLMPTSVVNAANANAGRATGLVYGPISIRMNTTDSEIEIEGLEQRHKGRLEPMPTDFKDYQDRDNELLLAVDLGLKSGVALYNKQGKLLRYEQHLFNRDKLNDEIKAIVEGWESDIQNSDTMPSSNEEPWTVTKIALEGGDVAIFNAWDSAAKDISITRVSPEEWRFHLLSEKERISGEASKAAARLIARQVVSDFGIMGNHEGKFKTDVAEAVLLGFYVCKKLGWISRDPIVRRYTNGNVIVPR